MTSSLQEFVAEALIVVEVGAALCKLQNLSDQMWIQQYMDEIKPYHLNRGTFGLDTFGLNMIVFFINESTQNSNLVVVEAFIRYVANANTRNYCSVKKMNKNETLKKD